MNLINAVLVVLTVDALGDNGRVDPAVDSGYAYQIKVVFAVKVFLTARYRLETDFATLVLPLHFKYGLVDLVARKAIKLAALGRRGLLLGLSVNQW